MKLRSASDMLLLREWSSRQIICTAKGVKKRGLGSPECNDHTAHRDQSPAYIDRCGGSLVEPDLGQYLGHQEKQHHINPKQFAKIPMGNIDREPIKRQHNRARDQENSAHRACRSMHAALK